LPRDYFLWRLLPEEITYPRGYVAEITSFKDSLASRLHYQEITSLEVTLPRDYFPWRLVGEDISSPGDYFHSTLLP
jgi:hypothetical protein